VRFKEKQGHFKEEEMRNQGQLYMGGAIIVIGVLILIGNLTNVDFGVYCWPLAFILLGVWLIVRPRMLEPGATLTQRLIGEIERAGDYAVTDEEFWAFIAELDLDMTQADIPQGETRLKVYGFVGEVDLLVPEDVGVAVSSTSFVNSIKMPTGKQESFVAPLRLQTDNYKIAERKIRLEMTCFVGEAKIRGTK
jgi:predicted membrane protein